MIAVRFACCLLLIASFSSARSNYDSTHIRKRLLLDSGWHFAFGHPYNTDKDFGHGTSYFSYLAKAGYGDGPADPAFDDRSWRALNLPHDWAAEQDFSEKGSFSHGFKAAGRAFPDKSIGWYRKTFTIPRSDSGNIITLTFDGVYRNAAVWINGHYLGTAASGYNSFTHDLTGYLNYGGTNVIAVRADATLEEGWFYEGAGIYRHVWLTVTHPLHIATDGIAVTTAVNGNTATITADVSVLNQLTGRYDYDIVTRVIDPQGHVAAEKQFSAAALSFMQTGTTTLSLPVTAVQCWSIDTPALYTLVTTIIHNHRETDLVSTRFGIRTLRFDAKEGFFLNGKHVTLKGTNNHQDHAGVGTAMPDALIEFRISTLKQMGCNAYRSSHHPPTPELLDICDRLGMLVIDENRLMGTAQQPLEEVKKMIQRDRNHPSVFCWSIGNEEWRLEGNDIGARMARTMQAYVKSIDSTRATTAGISGSFTGGIGDVLEVMGYNYMGNGDIEAHHRRLPQQAAMGTEEGSTFATRGIYETDNQQHYMAAYDAKPRAGFYSIEEGWNFYNSRPWLAGLFIWTGFDYRGEPTPFGWPSVNSYFGMMDICGFPKDNFYYLQSWWTDKPVLHVLPHWNWPGKEGKLIPVWVYSNCEEVELFLNKKSVGKKPMPRNGHLEWQVPYTAGQLKAVGYNHHTAILTETVNTAGKATGLLLKAHKTKLAASGEDVAVVSIAAVDHKGNTVPVADNNITFSVSGPGHISGTGNGNPTSLEKEIYTDSISNINLLTVSRADNATDSTYAYEGTFELPRQYPHSKITFFYKSIGRTQTIRVNGQLIATDLLQQTPGNTFVLDASLLKPGRNQVTVQGKAIPRYHDWDVINADPGIIQVYTPAAPWQRKLFNGKAQVIVQGGFSAGIIRLTAQSPGLAPVTLAIPVEY